MIIGINGKINSGKDTVGKIVQYLTYNKQMLGSKNYFYPTDVFLEELKNNPKLFNDEAAPFQIRKFADKLKDIVCLLLGCTREQLEDREFKEKELGEEWWYIKHYYPANKNKDKVLTLYPYVGFDSRIFDGDDSCMWEVIKTTPRLMLQLLGTECGRDIIHPNIWVNALMSDYNCIHCGQNPCGIGHKNVLGMKPNYPNWVITDMRFPNELKAIETRSGITIRVNRSYEGNNIVKKTDNGNGTITLSPADPNWGKIILNPHSSETALDDATFDYVINNNGTIEELIEKVRVILVKEKLL